MKKIIHHDQVWIIPEMQGWCNICKSINVIHDINRMKDKNHMIILMHAEKAFDKIQHPFMIKKNNFQQNGDKRNIVQYNKSHIWQSHGQYHTQWGTTKGIFLKIRNKTEMFSYTTLIQHSTRTPSHNIQKEEKIKVIHIRQEEVKLSLFAD